MAVDRIKKINIDERLMFTGIYGKSSLDESFIEKNMSRYHLWQELYLYLHELNYISIFYNEAYNFFSYQERDLEVFLGKNNTSNQFSSAQLQRQHLHTPTCRSRHTKCRGPLGCVRPMRNDNVQSVEPNESAQISNRRTVAENTIASTGLESHWPDIIIGGSREEGFFYQTKQKENRVLDRIYSFVDHNPQYKIAIVFTTPEKTPLGDEQERITNITKFQGRYQGHGRTDIPLRLICLYSEQTASTLYDTFNRERGFFFDTFFKNLLFPEISNEGMPKTTISNLFFLGNPEMDEIGNVLNRRRIMEGMKNVFNMPFDDTVRNLWQDFPLLDAEGSSVISPQTGMPRQIQSVNEMMNLDKEIFELSLSKLSNEKAMDRLRKLLGMEGVIGQFERYLTDLRASRERGEKFRPHMVFMGNPGTGKTTIARIFADVLREEGLLENGRLHQVTVGDLVAGYVGQTRIKTQDVCRKASGGVLFIDEAYGLYQSGNADTGGGNGGNSFGQEAIEVLLQFMENDSKSLVILAGYPKEIEDLLKNGNAGFNSRIGEQGRFFFEDYKPDVLTKIALSKLKGESYTQKFEHSLSAIFSQLYHFRDKDWANARTAENIISKIKSYYRSQHFNGVYDVTAIPDDLMRFIRIPSSEEETALLSELNEMVGLNKVKNSLGNIMNAAKANRIRAEKIGYTEQKLPNLSFIFEGHPGTGKTTVARMMGRILAGYGLIKSPEVKEYSKGKIISPVKGGSVKLVNEMFDNCIGKVLFIDEAYSLADPDAKDAVDQIVQCMTLPKYEGKMAVIMAGYPGDMQRLIDVNSGLDRRFTRLEFEDYTNEELSTIYHNYISRIGRKLGDGCDPLILNWFKSQKRDMNFGNAGLIIKLHQLVDANSGRRIANYNAEDKDYYLTYMPVDFPQASMVGKSEDEILKELNSLVGLRKVKETIKGLIDTISVEKMRIDAGQLEDYSEKRLNFVFKGNPGTGKTTVARLMGNILASYGMIADPEVLTYKKADLVDGTAGGGSRNVERMFQAGLGKVLFIDEAYQLADRDSKDALDAITNNMTDERYKNKMAIILAGYPGDMAQLIEGNSGLKSRFNFHVVFEDYNNEELYQIFSNKVHSAGFSMSQECYPYAMAYFMNINTGKKDFGNARETEGLLEKVKAMQGKRIREYKNMGHAITTEMLNLFIPADFPTYGKINPAKFKPQSDDAITGMDKLEALIGIDNIRDKFRGYIATLRYIRENPQSEIRLRPHMAFLGNPGTGKTTVAKLFGQILREEGLLPNSNFVQVSPSDLIGEYIGQSAIKAKGQFERARGGILFIDEAYQLLRKDQGRAGSYGEEVITELIQFMENDTDSIVILAGYSDETLWLINNGNPGLKSRIPESNYFIFEDYEVEVLYNIFLKKLSEYELTDALKKSAFAILTIMHANRPANWGNARIVEEFSGDVLQNYLILQDGKGAIDVNCISDRYMDYLQQGSAAYNVNNPTNYIPSAGSMTSNQCVNLAENHPAKQATDVSHLKNDATGLLKVRTSVGEGEGTGFIIQVKDRYVLTCSHVIEGASSIMFSMRSGTFETPAHVIWHNMEQDMALLQVDSLPDDACYLAIDSNLDKDPEELTKLILCGYPDGMAFASSANIIEGAITNYEKQRQWNDRLFDTIYANMSATHGCSGGPVVRKEDFAVVGLLQGGKEGGEIQFITDIHQLFRNINIKY